MMIARLGRSLRLLGSLLLCCGLLCSSAFANKINGVRVWPSPDNTRVVLDLADTPSYSYFSLTGPDRLVIDLDNVKQRFDFSKLQADSPLIKRIRHSGAKDKNSVRVVLDLTQEVAVQVFALKPTEPYGNRLVIDISEAKTSNPVSTAAAPTITHHADEAPLRDIIVAIDAGHGGEDPGSIGYSGSYEKHVTLAIAKELAGLIDKEPGMKAVLVRKGDYYVGFNKRTDIARKAGADLFISIHADAFTTPQPKGGSVWLLSMRRANSELGRMLEQREKHSELLGGVAEVIQDTENEKYLTQALLDMSMDKAMATSFDIGNEVIRELGRITKMHKREPQFASLAVLTSPDIPSLLVETGFISNPTEEKNLNSASHRKKLAESIYKAVKSHFNRMPPDGTLWAKAQRNNLQHKVRRGESLSVLAQKYNVSVDTIKLANQLNTDVLRIGQVLTIPRS